MQYFRSVAHTRFQFLVAEIIGKNLGHETLLIEAR